MSVCDKKYSYKLPFFFALNLYYKKIAIKTTDKLKWLKDAVKFVTNDYVSRGLQMIIGFNLESAPSRSEFL